MKKILIGLLMGIIAGILDISPMLIGKLPWDAIVSAFSLWVIAGFMISTSTLKLNNVVKGILISMLLLAPAGILIGWNDPVKLLPILAMTIILGGLLGYFIGKFTTVKN